MYTEEQAKEIVREAFGLKTYRRINNLINNNNRSASPGMKAFSEAIMVGRVEKMLAIADEAEDHAFAELEAIQEAEECGQKWIEIERSDGAGKFGIQTKKVSIAEAKRRWYERAKDDAREFFNVVRSTLPQTVVQTLVDNRSTVSQLDDADLDKQLDVEMRGFKWDNKRGVDKEDAGA